MIRACIFDLDGTIADTVESIAVVGNRMLEYYHLPAQPVKNYNFYAGDGADELVRRILEASGGTNQVNFEEARRLYRKWFEEDPFYHVKPFDGVPQMLEELKVRGLKIAVLSNKPHEAAKDVVNRIFGPDTFHKVQGQTASVPRKPSPIGALAVADEFHLVPEECLYVGDTNTDMQTGNAAGMYTVGVSWGFRPRSELIEYHAQRIIDSPDEILTLIKEKEHAEINCQ